MGLLTWVGGSFAARVLAARLTSEGIMVQLRGAIDSPYGFTMGDMARVEIWIPEDQLEEASLLLLADEVETVFDNEGDD